MSQKKGLAVISEVFNIGYTEIAEKIGRSKQEISMWANGKRSIPKKWLEELYKLEEFKVFKNFPESFLQSDLSELDVIDVRIAYYDYLAKKEGVEGDYSHYYYQKIHQLQDEVLKLELLMNVEQLLDDPKLNEYPDYLSLLQRINLIIHLKKDGRIEALNSMVKLLTDDIMNPSFDINCENDFTKELHQLLMKYDLLEEVIIANRLKKGGLD